MMADNWLILHGGALGDLVLTLQLALRLPAASGGCQAQGQRGPGERGAALHVLSRTTLGDLSACRPNILQRSSEGVGLQWLHGDGTDTPPPQLRSVVHGARVLSALGGPETGIHQRLAELGPAALYSLDPRPRPQSSRPIVEQWQTQFEAQGLLIPKCTHQRPTQRSLGVPDALRHRGRDLLNRAARPSDQSPSGSEGPSGMRPGDQGAGRRRVILHPGSGGRAKCWPTPEFIAVARQLQTAGLAPVFLLGPVERETWPAADMAKIQSEFAVLDDLASDDLVAVLSGANAYVGNDAGPTHLAALLGTPTVALFGPTPASVWRPLGANVSVLAGTPQLGPTWGIDPERVAAAVIHMTRP
jgi:hypothetical protein